MAASLIDPKQPGFNYRAVLDCAHASALAYVAETRLDEATDLARKWGLVKYKALSADPHFALLLSAPDRLILAFRGTTKSAHWMTNLNIALKRTPWGRVHRGFWEATHRFRPEPFSLIEVLSREQRPVSITGHSLGGALAVLTSAMIEWLGEGEVSDVITFGQPAVGLGRFNAEFTRRLGPRYVRFVHDVDGVSGIPELVYRHIAPPKYFDIDGRLWDGEPGWQSFKDHVKAPGKYGGPEMFKTHGMDHYLEALGGFAHQADAQAVNSVGGRLGPV